MYGSSKLHQCARAGEPIIRKQVVNFLSDVCNNQQYTILLLDGAAKFRGINSV